MVFPSFGQVINAAEDTKLGCPSSAGHSFSYRAFPRGSFVCGSRNGSKALPWVSLRLTHGYSSGNVELPQAITVDDFFDFLQTFEVE
jgi:hypothetical protein